MDAVGTHSRNLAVAAVLGLAALGGCAAYKAENKPLTEFPGIQGQIENFYDANAVEDDWVCDDPQMQNIDKSRVVSRSSTQVRMAVTYYFQSDDLSPGRGGDQCQGFNTRFFTFDTGPNDQLTLVSMSGPQRRGGA
jgi:hypothetical protein